MYSLRLRSADMMQPTKFTVRPKSGQNKFLNTKNTENDEVRNCLEQKKGVRRNKKLEKR